MTLRRPRSYSVDPRLRNPAEDAREARTNAAWARPAAGASGVRPRTNGTARREQTETITGLAKVLSTQVKEGTDFETRPAAHAVCFCPGGSCPRSRMGRHDAVCAAAKHAIASCCSLPRAYLDGWGTLVGLVGCAEKRMLIGNAGVFGLRCALWTYGESDEDDRDPSARCGGWVWDSEEDERLVYTFPLALWPKLRRHPLLRP